MKDHYLVSVDTVAGIFAHEKVEASFDALEWPDELYVNDLISSDDFLTMISEPDSSFQKDTIYWSVLDSEEYKKLTECGYHITFSKQLKSKASIGA